MTDPESPTMLRAQPIAVSPGRRRRTTVPAASPQDTAVVVCNVDHLPAWAAERLRDLVETVVELAPLRERLDEVSHYNIRLHRA